MTLETFLGPFMAELFEADSSIGNNDAVAKIQAYVKRQPNARLCDQSASHIGYLDCWRGFVRRKNAQAREQLKRMALSGDGGSSAFGQLQLPLPDGQSKVTMGKSRAEDLRRSAALMIGQARGLYATIRQTITAAELLELAGEEVGNPDLTLEEAIELGLIDINRLVAA